MRLRMYKSTDGAVLATLFFNTVHCVNAKDYSKPQLDAWATGNVDMSAWDQSFLEYYTLVAEANNIIVGFGNMDNQGYIDKLYVHKDYQNQGIATAIIHKLEQQAVLHDVCVFTTHASITAKPFFEKHGYCAVCENTVVRGNTKLTNFTMKKERLRHM